MKKLFSLFLTVSLISACNSMSNQNLDTQNDMTNISSSTKGIPSVLPNLPDAQLFSTFSNSYKILAEDNERIARADSKNNDKYFVKTILSAKQTLDCAFFDIQEDEIVSALVMSKQKGVNVRVVTDSDNMKDKVDPTLKRESILRLLEAGIEVVGDNRGPFMHHKFMVIDKKIVWHGATNPTTKGMFHHNSNSVFIRSEALAKNFSDEFNRMFEKKDFATPRKGTVSSPIVNVGDTTIKTFFSPAGGTKEGIIAELSNAKKSIKFMAFSFTDVDMANIMIAKRKSGLKVEGVYDECLNGKYSTYKLLLSSGVQVMTDGNQALLHSKTMIIDDKVVINGSFNFSKNAELNNNEDTLIITSSSFAQNFLKEYARIKDMAIKNTDIPPYDHPACSHGDPSETPVNTNKNSINLSTNEVPYFYDRD